MLEIEVVFFWCGRAGTPPARKGNTTPWGLSFLVHTVVNVGRVKVSSEEPTLLTESVFVWPIVFERFMILRPGMGWASRGGRREDSGVANGSGTVGRSGTATLDNKVVEAIPLGWSDGECAKQWYVSGDS